MNALEIIEKLRAENAKLQQENALLKTHAPYGILTRAAFEIEKRKVANGQYVIFGDVDQMHELNTQYGYEEVNARVRKALQIRGTDLLVMGLWFSGDEIVFVIRGDADGFVERVRNSFSNLGMGITLAGSEIVDGEIDIAIQIAAEAVQAQKAGRK